MFDCLARALPLRSVDNTKTSYELCYISLCRLLCEKWKKVVDDIRRQVYFCVC